ncbi:MAG: phage tail tape measure protein, partial [Alphaproteobacteria bacterium]|nr:phage tail tape measure protein [Alphaproteobacteria bacterium]
MLQTTWGGRALYPPGPATGRPRQGLRSISDGLERLQRIAQGTLLAGGFFEAARRVSGKAVREFSAIEDGLVGVAKTADLTVAQIARLEREITGLSLDPSVGATRVELLDIAQAAGQLGVQGVDNLTRFTRTVAQLQGATDLVGAEGATSLARILNVTGEGPERIDRLGSVIVRLGNTFAATESEITAAATRIATATARFPVSAAEAAALGAALRALGIEAELGGTAVGEGFGAIDAALRKGGEGARQLATLTGRSIEELRALFATDAVGVFQEVITALGRTAAAGDDIAGVLDTLGVEGSRAIAVYGTLATQAGILGKALGSAADEVERNTALTEESIRAAATFSRQLQLVRNEIDIQAAEVGGALAPALLTAAQNWKFLAAAASGGLGIIAGRGVNDAVASIQSYARELAAARRQTIAQAQAALDAASA